MNEAHQPKRGYRDIARLHAFVEGLIRHTLSSYISDGTPAKEILHSDFLSRSESEVPQDTVREGLEMLQAWEHDYRSLLERFHWVESSTKRPPFLETKPENQENGKQEKPRRRRRREKKPSDPSGSGNRGPE